MNIKKRKITNFINEDYKQYAIYTISSRGIPNVSDSLTPVQRMIVLHAPKTYQKTLSLVGEIFKTGRYHHGDCLEKNTKINLADGSQLSIGDWAHKYPKAEFLLKCVNEHGELTTGVGHSPRIGQTTDEYLEIELENGEIFKCTKNHPFLVDGKWVVAEDLEEGDDVKDFMYHRDDIAKK